MVGVVGVGEREEEGKQNQTTSLSPSSPVHRFVLVPVGRDLWVWVCACVCACGRQRRVCESRGQKGRRRPDAAADAGMPPARRRAHSFPFPPLTTPHHRPPLDVRPRKSLRQPFFRLASRAPPPVRLLQRRLGRARAAAVAAGMGGGKGGRDERQENEEAHCVLMCRRAQSDWRTRSGEGRPLSSLRPTKLTHTRPGASPPPSSCRNRVAARPLPLHSRGAAAQPGHRARVGAARVCVPRFARFRGPTKDAGHASTETAHPVLIITEPGLRRGGRCAVKRWGLGEPMGHAALAQIRGAPWPSPPPLRPVDHAGRVVCVSGALPGVGDVARVPKAVPPWDGEEGAARSSANDPHLPPSHTRPDSLPFQQTP